MNSWCRLPQKSFDTFSRWDAASVEELAAGFDVWLCFYLSLQNRVFSALTSLAAVQMLSRMASSVARQVDHV